jgi:hypothetical protein
MIEREADWKVNKHFAEASGNGVRILVDRSTARIVRLEHPGLAAPLLNISLPIAECRVNGRLHNEGEQGISFCSGDDASFKPDGDLMIFSGLRPRSRMLSLLFSFEPINWFYDKTAAGRPRSVWNLPFEWEQLRYDPEEGNCHSLIRSVSGTHRFKSRTYVDLVDSSGHGILIIHDGTSRWSCEGKQVRHVLHLNRDYRNSHEDFERQYTRAHYWLLPHKRMSSSQLLRRVRKLVEAHEGRLDYQG